MSHRHLPLRVSQIVAVIVAGIGLGIGADRYWSMERSEALLALAGPGPLRSDPGSAERSRAAEPDPGAPSEGRQQARALDRRDEIRQPAPRPLTRGPGA